MIDQATKKEKRVEESRAQEQVVNEENERQKKRDEELLDHAIQELSEEQKESLKIAFVEKMNAKSFFKTVLGSYGFDHHIVQGQWRVFLRENLLSKNNKAKRK